MMWAARRGICSGQEALLRVGEAYGKVERPREQAQNGLRGSGE